MAIRSLRDLFIDELKDVADAELAHEKAPDSLKDIMLIAAAQKVEHDEIATYGCLRAWASQLGETRAGATLEATLGEESAADERLARIAMSIDVSVTEVNGGVFMGQTTKAHRRA